MGANAAQQTPTIAPEEVHQALDRILRTKHFVNAHKKKKFLQLICDFYLEGRAHELNEHILGFDVFGRDSSFNPSSDPIVRVVAHEIRKKLEAYYKSEGASDPIRLDIPAGSYQPVFTRSGAESATPFETETSIPPRSEIETRAGLSRPSVGFGLTALALALAVIALVFYAYQLRQKIAETEAAKDPSSYGSLWSHFLGDTNPPLVILSNPVVPRVAKPSDSEDMIRDSIILPPGTEERLKDKFCFRPQSSYEESGGPAGDNIEPPQNKTTNERDSKPRFVLSQDTYTGIGEAIGLSHLTDFFRAMGRGIVVKQSRTVSAEDLKKHNMILLGGVWVNEWASKLARSEDFDFAFTNRATIENKNPQPGEKSEYMPGTDRKTGSLVGDYALVTLMPNISDSNEVMVLAGINSQGTEAAVEFVTNRNYLDQFNQRLKQAGSPRYFQALLKVGVANGISTTISIVTLHELKVAER